jgi:hypothetical protein
MWLSRTHANQLTRYGSNDAMNKFEQISDFEKYNQFDSAQTKLPKGYFFRTIFFISYFLMIMSSIKYIKDDIYLSENILAVRVILIVSAGVLWVARATIDRTLPPSVLLIGIVLSGYALTDAVLAFVDLITLIIFASAMKDSGKPERYFILLAYWSLAFVCLITFAGSVGLIPSAIFEWEGRAKNSFGFTNPNVLFFYVFSSALTFFVCRERNGLIICGAIMAFLYTAVGSRTFAFAYLLIALAYFFVLKVDNKFVRFTLWVFTALALIFGVMTVYFPFEFSMWTSNVLGIDSDALLSNRLTIMETVYISSKDAEFWFGGLENLSDSMYSYFTRSFGLGGSLILLVAAIINLKNASNIAGAVPLVFFLTFFVVGLVEVPFDGTSLVSLIFIYAVFYDHTIFSRWRDNDVLSQNSVPKRRWI